MTSKGTMNSVNSALDANPNKERSGSGQKFTNLQDQKRGSGQGTNAEANRQSFTEQTKTQGSIGEMWDKFTKGK